MTSDDYRNFAISMLCLLAGSVLALIYFMLKDREDEASK